MHTRSQTPTSKNTHTQTYRRAGALHGAIAANNHIVQKRVLRNDVLVRTHHHLIEPLCDAHGGHRRALLRIDRCWL